MIFVHKTFNKRTARFLQPHFIIHIPFAKRWQFISLLWHIYSYVCEYIMFTEMAYTANEIFGAREYVPVLLASNWLFGLVWVAINFDLYPVSVCGHVYTCAVVHVCKCAKAVYHGCCKPHSSTFSMACRGSIEMLSERSFVYVCSLFYEQVSISNKKKKIHGEQVYKRIRMIYTT